MNRQWEYLGAVVDQEPIYFREVNLWKHMSKATGESVVLPDPKYLNQQNRMFVYHTNIAGEQVTFAAGEFSASVVGFYVAA